MNTSNMEGLLERIDELKAGLDKSVELVESCQDQLIREQEFETRIAGIVACGFLFCWVVLFILSACLWVRL